MELYHPIIRKVAEQVGFSTPRVFPYDPAKAWTDTGNFELVMLRDAAYELGGENKPAVNFTCVTTSPQLVNKDEIFVYGPDLNELKADSAYARITLLRVGDIESDDENDTEQAFRAIQDMDFVKYRVFPKGYMIRTSSESNREQVRISKESIRDGITFEKIGNRFIRQYKENPNILNVKLLFITAPDADYTGLMKSAKNVHDITMSLTKILEGMPTDCGSCNLKSICDEVEGMRELHFGKEKHTTE
ncbi:MAG: carbon monoxide dehydrogenase [Eubacteriales bacterium]|nr:carbon monoxide dehydrogenase [Eubacteriales bacterium]